MSNRWALLRGRPTLTAVTGSIIIAWAAILVRLADVSVASSATYRCLYALPLLIPLAVLAQRRMASAGGNPNSADRRFAARWSLLSGVGLAGRLLFWHAAIALVGAGLATVLVNAQAAIVPLAAWVLLAERPTVRQVTGLPFVLVGCLLISGVVGADSYGSNPGRGAALGLIGALAYALFLIGLRGGAARGAPPVTVLAVASAVSALITGAWGLSTQALEVPGWPAQGWLVLLALGCQGVGWLMIAVSLTALPAATVSVVVLLQPIGSMVLGVALFSETPGALQWVGVLVSLVGFAIALAPREQAPRDPAVTA